MTYEEFLDFVPAKCMYETIYDDSDGRTILVIRMLDAYKFITQWQGTHGPDCWSYGPRHYDCAIKHIESLKK